MFFSRFLCSFCQSSTIPNSHDPIAIIIAVPFADPVVAAEFAQVQPMAFEDVEEELQESGIRVGATMNDMEAKLMLVEMRLRLSGKLNGNDEKKRPAKFSSKLEEAIWTKPAFEAFYSKVKSKGDAATANVVRMIASRYCHALGLKEKNNVLYRLLTLSFASSVGR